MSNKSLEYYHKVVKHDPERMARRKAYYKEYYQKNKNQNPKPKKLLGISIKYGNYTINFN